MWIIKKSEFFRQKVEKNWEKNIKPPISSETTNIFWWYTNFAYLFGGEKDNFYSSCFKLSQLFSVAEATWSCVKHYSYLLTNWDQKWLFYSQIVGKFWKYEGYFVNFKKNNGVIFFFIFNNNYKMPIGFVKKSIKVSLKAKSKKKKLKVKYFSLDLAFRFA